MKLHFNVKENLFDSREPNTLGLERAPGSETFTVYKPEENSDKYSHGAVIVFFRGEYFVQWQSSAADEDAADTKVVYSRSSDLKKWSEPCVISEALGEGNQHKRGMVDRGQYISCLYKCMA